MVLTEVLLMLSTVETETERSALELAVVRELRRSGMDSIDAEVMVSEMEVDRRQEYLFQAAQVVDSHPENPNLVVERGMFAPADYSTAHTAHASLQRHVPRLAKAGLLAAGAAMVFAPVTGVLMDAFTPSAYAADLPTLDGAFVGADNSGRFGTHWTSSMCAVQDSADNVVLKLYPGSLAQPVDAARFIQLDVPRGEQVCVENVLAGFGDFVAPGAVFYDWEGIDPDQGYVFSRTSTVRPSGAPGSMGQGFPGVDFEAVAAGKTQVVPTAHDAEHFRTNVGVVNGNSFAVEFDVAIRGSGGAVLADTVLDLPAGSWFQYNDIYAKLGIPARAWSYVTVTPSHNLPIGNFLVDSSVVDNASGDPTHNQGQSHADTPTTVFLPAAARLPGANGTEWVTDLDVMNWGGLNTDNFLSTFLLEGQDNFPGGIASYNIPMVNGELFQEDDMVLQMYGLDGVKGAVVTGSNMQIFSRTFTTEDGQTFGAGLPGQRVDEHAIGSDQYGVLPHLQQSSDRHTGFRTNIGLVNASIETRTATIELYDGATLVDTIQKTLAPWDMTQLNKAYGNTDITDGWARITSDASGVQDDEGVIAYGSVVDNHSGDGSVVMAKRIGPSGPSIDDQIREYIDLYFPTNDARFFLSDTEARAIINGDMGTRSYTLDLATELWNDPVMQGEFDDISGIVAWFEARADGVPGNSEYCPDFDPVQWDNDAFGDSTFRVYDGLSCGPVDFRPGEEPMLRVYDMIKNDFMFNFIKANPELYGGQSGGAPDMDFNPTWNDG
ncbi:hypothetical protein GOV07_02965 [Candidatus Woesearchaeota archaeon]|nr:hypothetical protein [Candidatus Woesearchaeota archaeon]